MRAKTAKHRVDLSTRFQGSAAMAPRHSDLEARSNSRDRWMSTSNAACPRPMHRARLTASCRRFSNTSLQQFGALPVLWRAEIVAVVMLAPLGIYSTLNNDRPFEWVALAAVLALGVLGTAVAHYAMVMLAGRLGSTRASASLYLMPAVSLALGVVVNNEDVALLAIVGSGVAVLGAYVLSRSTWIDSLFKLLRCFYTYNFNTNISYPMIIGIS